MKTVEQAKTSADLAVIENEARLALNRAKAALKRVVYAAYQREPRPEARRAIRAAILRARRDA